ncbi:MAG: sigma-54-dependent Fis family transcriptional regulator [Deltaproteobacteria bacterium]|nr:sigma-54-dependent Fis family transcriptional regulator [Deltaproteobacteria bacterium]
MSDRTILIVDDDEGVSESLRSALIDEGYTVRVVGDGKTALSLLRQWEPDLVLLDIWLPDIDGISVLEKIRQEERPIQVVVMSGHGTVESAVKATKLGAFDFLEKPISLEKLLVTIHNIYAMQVLRQENIELRKRVGDAAELIGESRAIADLLEQVRKAAPTNSGVMITGENGTGKELVARKIHDWSLRQSEPFVEVNCAAIPEELIESELFGYERGAFTGATARKKGKFELAHGGTLFLDEIGDMSLRTQAKILRVLQEQQFQRIGGAETVKINVRIVAATNKDLSQEIERGHFREDLFYRLNVIPLYVPPLRERAEDIPLLVTHFLGQIAAQNGRKLKPIDLIVISRLQAYYWPGNVRELKNIVERMFILSTGETITESDLPPLFHDPKESGGSLSGTDELFRKPNLKGAKGDFERVYITKKLEEFGGNITKTAEAIGIERSHLHRKIKNYEIPS